MEHNRNDTETCGQWRYSRCTRCHACISERERDGFTRGWKVKISETFSKEQWQPAPECPDELTLLVFGCGDCSAKREVVGVPFNERLLHRFDDLDQEIVVETSRKVLSALGLGRGWQKRYGPETLLPVPTCHTGGVHSPIALLSMKRI